MRNATPCTISWMLLLPVWDFLFIQLIVVRWRHPGLGRRLVAAFRNAPESSRRFNALLVPCHHRHRWSQVCSPWWLVVLLMLFLAGLPTPLGDWDPPLSFVPSVSDGFDNHNSLIFSVCLSFDVVSQSL